MDDERRGNSITFRMNKQMEKYLIKWKILTAIHIRIIL